MMNPVNAMLALIVMALLSAALITLIEVNERAKLRRLMTARVEKLQLNNKEK